MRLRRTTGHTAKEKTPKGQATAQLLVGDLERLDQRYIRGDVRPKDYVRQHATLVEELGRAKLRPHLEPGEQVLAEHYVVQGHFKLTQSVLKESAQEAAGFLATDRRLFRWSFQDKPSPQAELLPDFEEKIECRWYSEVSGLRWCREVRWSEALTGIVIIAVAVLIWPLLEVIGPVLMLTGLGGILHALLWPTPWLAVTLFSESGGVWRIDAPQKPSGRKLRVVIGAYLEPLPVTAPARETKEASGR